MVFILANKTFKIINLNDILEISAIDLMLRLYFGNVYLSFSDNNVFVK